MVEESDVDHILQIISNPIRRKMLMRLVEGETYPLQLAKDLRVSQQSIAKHLKILEKHKVVEHHVKKSKLGGPKRKYYELSKTISIYIDLTPKSFFLNNFSGEKVHFNDRCQRFLVELDDINKRENDAERFRDIKKLSAEVDNEIDEIVENHKMLLAVKNEINKEVDKLITQNYDEDSLEHRILWHMIENDNLTPRDLSNMLDIREKDIENLWERIVKKFFM